MSDVLSEYQVKYYAHLLTRKAPSNDREKIIGTILDAKVEPKPHQIEAALFAFRSPFSKGAILADEVGLGKTIEAGIIISQYWSEYKRKILIVAPASLRQQWSQELREKFFLDSTILDSKVLKDKFEQSETLQKDHVYIASYDFTRRYAELLSSHNFNLVIFDEAHKLRNVYKPDNVTANIIKNAFKNTPKLLLTATPLQNSLLELYGLVSIIDDNYFGSFEAFKEKYVTSISVGSRSADKKMKELRDRLKPLTNRALRRQVQEYINYTNRQSFTERFSPSDEEIHLYDLVTEYLGRDDIYAFSNSQRALTTLLMLKLLGSSSHAISVTLTRLADRVEAEAKEGVRRDARGQKLFDEDIEELIDEDLEEADQTVVQSTEKLTDADIQMMRLEAKELRHMASIAKNIQNESKGLALLKALKHGFDELPKLHANRKAIIFTESTRTQDYIYELLKENGYGDKIVKFNGSGGGPEGNDIFSKWQEKYKDTDRVSGVKSADRRQALVDYFKDEAEVMIATEAAGEGINLQFCSMVINYDLPWNPQRVEQRIGRCHRYGQKSDVIVINFLNEHNRAEQRILQLLQDKFQLFNGVFGASDQILGAIESGFDFERKIADIVRTCRTVDQIEESFNTLQDDLSEKIDKKMRDTRKDLLDNFDSEVAERLKVSRDESDNYLNKYEEILWQLVKYYVPQQSNIENTTHSFTLTKPYGNAQPGRYYIGNHEQQGYKLRLQHPLVEYILDHAKTVDTPRAKIVFDYNASKKKTKALENYINQGGTLALIRYALESPAQYEEHFLPLAVTTRGKHIPPDLAGRLLEIPTSSIEHVSHVKDIQDYIDKSIEDLRATTRKRDSEYLKEEGQKLDAWAADMRRAAKLKMTKLDKDIRQLKKDIRHINDVEQELKTRQRLRKLERKRDDHEFDYRVKLKEIDKKTDELLDTIEQSLQANEKIECLYEIEWELR
jgi:ERCC4-related helicase